MFVAVETLGVWRYTYRDMLIKLLKAKIHNATVTFTDINYHGSITIDSNLLKASGMLPNEAVIVADCENGNRFETYIIPGEAGSGMIGINGAAARLTAIGHRVIVMCFAYQADEQVARHQSKVLIVDQRNALVEVIDHPTRLE